MIRPDQTMLLMGGLSQEFDTLADGIEGLVALVTRAVRDADDQTRHHAIRQAQSIDEMAQRCRALAELTSGLAREMPLRATLDDVPLSALVERLSQALRLPVADPTVRPDAGDLMLFD